MVLAAAKKDWRYLQVTCSFEMYTARVSARREGSE